MQAFKNRNGSIAEKGVGGQSTEVHDGMFYDVADCLSLLDGRNPQQPASELTLQLLEQLDHRVHPQQPVDWTVSHCFAPLYQYLHCHSKQRRMQSQSDRQVAACPLGLEHVLICSRE